VQHPIQPICRDADGVVRFHANGIVRRLFKKKIVELATIANWVAQGHVTQDDADQWYQLMGYSVGGYSELAGSGAVSEAAADRAEATEISFTKLH
jgi:hypothetical protein